MQWIISDAIVPFLIGIIASLFVVIILDFYTFRRYFTNLCSEIIENYKKIQDEKLIPEFLRMQKIFEKKIEDPNYNEWVGFRKIVSVWIFVQNTDRKAVDYSRYLSSNDLRNFIQHGYYDYIKEYEENLTLFYLNCENLSNLTQDLERDFNYFPDSIYPNFTIAPDDKKREYYMEYVRSVWMPLEGAKPAIESRYRNLQPLISVKRFHMARLFIKGLFS